jgi:hypothetical protein
VCVCMCVCVCWYFSMAWPNLLIFPPNLCSQSQLAASFCWCLLVPVGAPALSWLRHFVGAWPNLLIFSPDLRSCSQLATSFCIWVRSAPPDPRCWSPHCWWVKLSCVGHCLVLTANFWIWAHTGVIVL